LCIDLLPETLAQLAGRINASIAVLNLKTQRKSGQALIAERKERLGLELLAASYLNRGIQARNIALEKAAQGYQYLDLVGIYCQVLTEVDEVIFYDNNHVTPSGAEFIGALM
jgi:hypothetical protein